MPLRHKPALRAVLHDRHSSNAYEVRATSFGMASPLSWPCTQEYAATEVFFCQ